MTTAYTLCRHYYPLDRAMFFNGFPGVTRAAWIETATRPNDRADQVRIYTYDAYKDFLHVTSFCQCFCSESLIALLVSFPGFLFVITTTSMPLNSCWFLRKLSLAKRLSLFLVTASLTHFLDIARPRRA